MVSKIVKEFEEGLNKFVEDFFEQARDSLSLEEYTEKRAQFFLDLNDIFSNFERENPKEANDIRRVEKDLLGKIYQKAEKIETEIVEKSKRIAQATNNPFSEMFISMMEASRAVETGDLKKLKDYLISSDILLASLNRKLERIGTGFSYQIDRVDGMIEFLDHEMANKAISFDIRVLNRSEMMNKLLENLESKGIEIDGLKESITEYLRQSSSSNIPAGVTIKLNEIESRIQNQDKNSSK